MELTEKEISVLSNSLKNFQKEIHKTALSKGWWEPLRSHPHLRALLNSSRICEEEKKELLNLGSRNEGEALALMHSELSEALENVRNGHTADDHVPEFKGVEVELADVIIRIFDWAEAKNYRVVDALFAKALINKGRPYLHGRKF